MVNLTVRCLRQRCCQSVPATRPALLLLILLFSTALSAAVMAQTASGESGSATSASQTSSRSSTQSPDEATRRKAYTKFLEAQSLRGNKRLREATEAYKEAIRLDPKSIGARILVARLYMATVRTEAAPSVAQVDRAIDGYKEVVKLEPTN